MSGLRVVEARGEVTSSPSSRTVPLVDTRQVLNPSAGPPREIRPSVISLASARALACHVDWHVDRTVGQPAVGREDLGKTAVNVSNVAAQQCLNLRNMRAHA